MQIYLSEFYLFLLNALFIRLLPEVIKPRLPGRPPQRLMLPPPPTLRIRLPLPKLPPYLYFICFSSLEELVNLHNSTRGVYFELLLEDSAKGLCYVNIYPNSIFSCSLFFWLFSFATFS